MMTLRARIIVVAIIVLGLLAIIHLVKKKRLEIKYALLWLFMGVVVIVIAAVPPILPWMATVMGIYDATNMIFFIGFVVAIGLIFALTMSISRNSDRVRKLTQQVALNEQRIKQLESELEKKDSEDSKEKQ